MHLICNLLLRFPNGAAEVTLDVPSAHIVAAITRASLDRLQLEPGSAASAYVKAIEVTLGR